MLATVDIETIVRQVIADLAGSGSAPASPVMTSPATASPVTTSPIVLAKKQESTLSSTSLPSSDDMLRLNDKLVTIASLDGKLSGIKKIQIARKTVVTPAVHDHLRKQNILLEVVAETPGIAETNQTIAFDAPVWVALHHLKKEPSSLLEFLEKQWKLDRESFRCIIKTVQAAVDQQKRFPELRMIILTSLTAPALCLANRHHELRAILGQNTNQIPRDTKAVGANMLVLDPTIGSAYQLQDFARTFLLTPPHCAEAIGNALGGFA